VERQLPRDFAAGLIEARDRLPGANFVELRVDVPLDDVLYLEDAAHVLSANFPLVGDMQLCPARSHRASEGEHDLVLIHGHDLERNGCAAGGERCFLYLQFLGPPFR